jgi:hypothetical protein
MNKNLKANTIVMILMGVTMLANIFDVYATRELLNFQKHNHEIVFYEANPILRHIIENTGDSSYAIILLFKIIAVVILTIFLLLYKKEKNKVIVSLLVSGIYIALYAYQMILLGMII